MRTLFCILWLILVSIGTALAVPTVPDPLFQTLSTKQGLSQDIINDIIIDQDGFVWIATEGGLDRWDGVELERILGPGNIFENSTIASLLQDSTGDIWIGTFSDGVFRYDLENNTIEPALDLKYQEFQDISQFVEMFADESINTLLIAFSQQVVRFDKRYQTHEVVFTLPKDNAQEGRFIRAIQLVDNYLLVATSAGLYAVDLNSENNTFQLVNHLADLAKTEFNINTKSFLLDRNDNVWLGTVTGLFRANKQALKTFLDAQQQHTNPFQEVSEQRNIWDIHETANDEIWFGTDIGLMRLQMANNGPVLKHVLVPKNGYTDLQYKRVKVLTSDSNNNFWLGTHYGGALYWVKESLGFESISSMSSRKMTGKLSHDVVWSIIETEPDIIWIGTESGLNRLDLKHAKIDNYLNENMLSERTGEPLSFEERSIDKMFLLPQRRLLLSTQDGIRIFDINTEQLYVPQADHELAEEIFRGFNFGAQLDKEGRLYFLNHEYSEYFRYDTNTLALERLPLVEQSKELDIRFSHDGFVDVHTDGRIFLSTYENLWLIDPDTFKAEKVLDYPEHMRSREYAVNSVVTDNDGTMWLGFSNFGILGLDANTYAIKTELNRDNLLASNIAYSLQLDDLGNLWFSSHSGLHRYSPANNTVRDYHYGVEVNAAEFNQDVYTRLHDGRLAFGSTNGIVIVDTERLNRDVRADVFTASMAITELSLESRQIDTAKRDLAGSHFTLAHDDYGISIRFSPMVMASAVSSNFKYRLMKNGNLVSVGQVEDPRVSFAILPPGEYRFEVSLFNQNADFTILPSDITFTIPYPPFRSPFAYFVYAISVLLIISLYWHRRRQAQDILFAAQQQVKLFGDAFKHTRDWVIIFDHKNNAVAVNPAFAKAFSLNTRLPLQAQMDKLFARTPKLKRQLLHKIAGCRPGEFRKDEDVIEVSDGNSYDVLMDVTAITSDQDVEVVSHYLIVISDITEQKHAERKLIKVANYDALTGLVNRALLLDRLEHAIALARKHDTKVAVLFVDLDRFKGINDSLGHDYGDRLLKVIATRMVKLASNDDTVARLGGDEFVIVMEEVDTTNHLSSFVSALIETVETPIALGKEVLRVSCSVGISIFPGDGQTSTELLKQADVAMYNAKKDMVDGFTFYTTEMNEQAKRRLFLENRVKKAYQEQRFVNYYQPIIDTQQGKLAGMELLLRCNMSQDAISPEQFIPILEELKYIIDVTRDAIKRAVEDLAKWYDDGFTGYVSVNLSALHFKSVVNIESIRQLLDEHSLPVTAIRFEITEGVLMDDTVSAKKQIEEMIEQGFVLALDDFGTGYSSLGYLKRFPLQILKIDKSFVDDIGDENNGNALALTTVNLAKSLSMISIAEGVENEYQAKFLAQNGCYLQQGFFFSRPVDAKGISTLLSIKWPKLV